MDQTIPGSPKPSGGEPDTGPGYRSLFVASLDAVLLMAPEGRILAANPAACRLFDRSEEELKRLGRGGVADPSDPRLAAAVAECTQKGRFQGELTLVRKDGVRLPGEVSSVAFDNGGGARCVSTVIRNLTAGKDAEEELQFRNLILSTQQETSLDGIVVVDESGRIISFNRRFADMWGVPSDIMESQSDEHALQWAMEKVADPDGFISRVKHLYENRHEVSRDEVALKDGRTFDRYSAPMLGPDRRYHGRVWYFRDITEHRRTEDALRLGSAAMEAAGSAIVILNKAGIIVSVNPAFTALTGYAASEVVGRDMREIESPERDDQELYRHICEMMRSRKAWYGEVAIRRKDGGLCFTEMTLAAVCGADGEISHFIIIQQDITERKRTAEMMREQAQLLNQANDAIYVRSFDGVVSYWNEGAERLYGWSRAEAIGRQISDLNVEEAMNAADVNCRLLKDGNWIGERRQVTRGGQEIMAFCRLTAVKDESGQPSFVFAINTDITEKKQFETRFLQAQRFENLGFLAAGVAHDLNNVLTPILLAASTLKEAAKTEAEKQMLAVLESSARRGSNIVRQIIAFTRGVRDERRPLQPRHLLRDLRDIAAETFPRNIRFEMHAPEDLWPVVGDATQLHQILLNLTINARDAMPNGGRLVLAAENVELDETSPGMAVWAKAGPHVCLKVSDTGTGIDPEHQSRIFEPFFTTKEKGKGTGLGLPTVLGLVKGHGGFLRFHSTVGHGTCFEVYLPASPTADPSLPAEAAAGLPHGRGETILVVDDEAAIRTIATGILEKNGYAVVSAAEGSEALDLFALNRSVIAIVVTDMMMAGMDGPSLVKALRQIDPAARIIGISGGSEQTDLNVIQSLKLSGFLMKPFTAEKLLTVLQMVLQAQPGTKGGEPGPPAPGSY